MSVAPATVVCRRTSFPAARILAALCLWLACGAAYGMQNTTTGSPANQSASGNAATQWRELFPSLRNGDNNPLHMTSDDWDAITELSIANQPGMKQIDRGRLAMEKLQPIMDQLVSTSRIRKSDFEHDYSQGFDMLLPELSPMRQAARVLRARAFLALTDGDWDAYANTVGAESNLSRQIAQSPNLISSLVAGAVGNMPIGDAQQLVDEGNLTPERAEQLLKELAPLRGSDPFGYSKSVEEEYKVMLASNYDGKKLMEALGNDSDNDRFKNLDAAAVHQAMLPLAGMYQEAATAMKEPDEDAARKRWEAAWNSRDKLPRSSQILLELVMPSIEKIIEVRFRNQSQIDSLIAALMDIASGKIKSTSLASPAIWWSRAAAAARALNDEQQAAMVMQQLSSVPDDSPLLPLVSKTLDAADATVFECMRRAMACESKAVSFSKVARDNGRNPLDLALIGGLRGAARMAMAKSLRTSGTEPALAYLAMAFAAGNALAADPTFPHALAAQSIADELADAVWRFAIRSGVSEEQRSRLDAIIATIPRSDAFGFIAAQKKARAALADDLRYDFDKSNDAQKSADVKELLTKSLAQKPPAWLLAVSVVQGYKPPAAGPEGSLVSTDDLFAPDTLKALGDAWGKAHEDDNKDGDQTKPLHAWPASTPDSQRVRKFLGDLNPPAVRDLSMDMNRVGDTLSAIDAAAKKRRESAK